MPERNLPAVLAVQPLQAVTGVAATDLFTATAHGYNTNDSVVFSTLTGGTGIVAGTAYYVLATGLTANAFKVSATPAGAALDVTVDLTGGFVQKTLNWGNARAIFSNEELGYLAKYYQMTFNLALTDATVMDNAVLRNFFMLGALPA